MFIYVFSLVKCSFAFHDGAIGELCPEEIEENWVINFKRGILSSLQNTMQRFDIDYKATETDVSGTCNVNYVLSGTEKTSLNIKKSKDMSTCINRYKTHSFLQTTPYDFRKQYAVWPLLRSSSYCNVSQYLFSIDNETNEIKNDSEMYKDIARLLGSTI